MRRFHRLAGGSALLLGLVTLTGASAPGPALGPTGPRREMGFVFNAFAPAIYQGKDDCPDGLAGTVRENYLYAQPATEQARLSLKVNEKELTQRWKASIVGPNNTNICTNPELFQRPLQPTIQGKVAPGLNLDGDGAGSCAHDNFIGVDGAAGVDNQAYRAMGCTRNYRGVDGTAGDVVAGFNGLLATGEHSVVLLLRGVDSLANDDDVEVILGSTDDRPVLDSQRHFITGASFSFSDRNPAWRNVLHGRIVDGVLTTDPADIRLKRPWGHGGVRGAQAEWDLRRARLQLRFQPDGSVKGLLGAYQTPRNVMLSTIVGGLGAAETAGIDCAAEMTTLTHLADGLRDPKSGQCTAVSMALDIAAIPAFVNDIAPKPSLAVAGGPR